MNERMRLIGLELRRLRRSEEKTLQDVAEHVGLKKNTISAYEKGKIEIPISNLSNICNYLDIDYITLLDVVENKLK